MAKYITAFETINDYNVSKEGLDYPNISLIKSDGQIEWVTEEPPTPQYQGFCKLTLNDGSVVELEGSGELTQSMISSYKSTLVSAEIGTLCTSISKSAFYQCSSLTSIDIPDSVTSIGGYAFYGCTSLTSIEMPSSVTSIGEGAFNSCTSLTNITIPNSVTSIGNAFNKTPWWSAYSADTSNHYGNIIYINNVACKATATTITSCEFKEGTVSIGGSAFSLCRSLTNIEIPNSVTSISEGAFSSCYSFTSIVIPNSVTSIGSNAFQSCTGLTSVIIPSSVTSIDYGAFSYCSGLTSVTVESTTPPTLGSHVFNSDNNYPIYVPSESVEAYKSATNWSNYASRIQAIS